MAGKGGRPGPRSEDAPTHIWAGRFLCWCDYDAGALARKFTSPVLEASYPKILHSQEHTLFLYVFTAEIPSRERHYAHITERN